MVSDGLRGLLRAFATDPEEREHIDGHIPFEFGSGLLEADASAIEFMVEQLLERVLQRGNEKGLKSVLEHHGMEHTPGFAGVCCAKERVAALVGGHGHFLLGHRGIAHVRAYDEADGVLPANVFPGPSCQHL